MQKVPWFQRNRFIQTKGGKELIARKHLGCSWIWKAQQETWWRRGAPAMASAFQGGFVFLWWLIWSLLLVIPTSPLAWLISCSRDLVQILKELISLIWLIIILLSGRELHGSLARLTYEFCANTVCSMTTPPAPPCTKNNLELLS